MFFDSHCHLATVDKLRVTKSVCAIAPPDFNIDIKSDEVTVYLAFGIHHWQVSRINVNFNQCDWTAKLTSLLEANSTAIVSEISILSLNS